LLAVKYLLSAGIDVAHVRKIDDETLQKWGQPCFALARPH